MEDWRRLGCKRSWFFCNAKSFIFAATVRMLYMSSIKIAGEITVGCELYLEYAQVLQALLESVAVLGILYGLGACM